MSMNAQERFGQHFETFKKGGFIAVEFHRVKASKVSALSLVHSPVEAADDKNLLRVSIIH